MVEMLVEASVDVLVVVMAPSLASCEQQGARNHQSQLLQVRRFPYTVIVRRADEAVNELV